VTKEIKTGHMSNVLEYEYYTYFERPHLVL